MASYILLKFHFHSDYSKNISFNKVVNFIMFHLNEQTNTMREKRISLKWKGAKDQINLEWLAYLEDDCWKTGIYCVEIDEIEKKLN